MLKIDFDLNRSIYSSPIMIVDDSETNQIFLTKILTKRGFCNLLNVYSGEEALARIDDFYPQIIISDVIMPGIDGFELCKIIKNQPKYHDIPILMQTVINDPDLKVKAFACGASDFVSKPIYPDELCARVVVHLEKSLYTNNLQLYKQRVEQELDMARDLQFWHNGKNVGLKTYIYIYKIVH